MEIIKTMDIILMSICCHLLVGVQASIFTQESPSRWEIAVYSPCSQTCGRGSQSRLVRCVDGVSGAPTSEWTCPSPKPTATKSCAIIPCAPEWESDTWGECSKTCGRGFHTRKVRCRQRLANGKVAVVSPDYCPRRRPSLRKRCGLRDCPARYVTRKWSECLSSCGGGTQFREIKCVRIKADGHVLETVSTSYCEHLTAPETNRKCNAGKCPGAPAKSTISRSRKKKAQHLQRIRGRSPKVFRRHGTQNSITRRRIVSTRRRSVRQDRRRFYRCRRSRISRSYPRRTTATPPCPRPENLIPAARTPQLQAFRNNRNSRVTKPFITSPGEDGLPVRVREDIVTYVGGTMTVSDTDIVTILCEASGNPPPVTEWLKNGEPIHQDDRHALLGDSSLRIIHPFISDGGNYTCVARNSAGAYAASTILSVAKKPRIISHLDDSQQLNRPRVEALVGNVIRASPGTSIRIKCPVEGFPPPRVRWEKDVAGLGDNVQILPDNSLLIDLAGPVDQGLYNCEATNPIGTDYRSTTLLLFEAPKLQEYLTSQDRSFQTQQGLPRLLMASDQRPIYKIDSGAGALIGCPVKGLGHLDMSWSLGRAPLRSSLPESRYEILVDGKVLFLTSVDQDSHGVYSCHASNEAGNLTASLEIAIAKYMWQVGDLGQCSHTCGGNGFRQRTAKCLREGAEQAADSKCDPDRKPALRAFPCNRKSCPPTFSIGPWSECSSTCGAGSRRRKVTCRVEGADNSSVTVEPAFCEASRVISPQTQKRRPVSVEACSVTSCPRWAAGPWSECGDKCYGRGMGIRVRRVHCLNGKRRRTSVLNCMQSKRPKWREICFTMKCQPVWVVSKWSSCSKSCGPGGIQTRILNCVYRGHRRQRAGASCDAATRPPVTMSCAKKPCSDG